MKSETVPTSSRKAARESAFKAMYAMTVGAIELDAAMDVEVLGREFSEDSLTWIRTMVGGIMANPHFWDDRFRDFLTANWPLDRIAVTDKTALRMACYELWRQPETPPKVIISEYVEMAKRYGSKESGKFVNGVLASVLKVSPKADWTPPVSEPVIEQKPIVEPEEPEKKAPTKRKSWTLKSED